MRLQADGEHEEAEHLFLEVAEQDPERTDLCIYNIAVIAETDGDHTAADELYGKV